jgi:hypothetical protein
MKLTSYLFLLTIAAFAIWVTSVAGWLALALYLLALTALSFVVDVIIAARRLDNGNKEK